MQCSERSLFQCHTRSTQNMAISSRQRGWYLSFYVSVTESAWVGQHHCARELNDYIRSQVRLAQRSFLRRMVRPVLQERSLPQPWPWIRRGHQLVAGVYSLNHLTSLEHFCDFFTDLLLVRLEIMGECGGAASKVSLPRHKLLSLTLSI